MYQLNILEHHEKELKLMELLEGSKDNSNYNSVFRSAFSFWDDNLSQQSRRSTDVVNLGQIFVAPNGDKIRYVDPLDTQIKMVFKYWIYTGPRSKYYRIKQANKLKKQQQEQVMI